MKKKAQVSLEYLMTYGWVIVIVVIALVVIWQWGLFQPKPIPKGYAGFWGVVPEDFSYDSGGTLQLSIRNEIGAKIQLIRINATIGEESYQVNLVSVQLAPGENYLWPHTFSSSSSRLGKGSRFEISLWIEYQDSRTGETYRSSGKIWGSVEGV